MPPWRAWPSSLTSCAAPSRNSTSALAQAPIALATCSVAVVPAYADIAADVEPVATFELMASARRQIGVGIDAAAGATLAGAAVIPSILAGGIIEAIDGAFSDLLGEGISLGAADAAEIPADARILAVRMQLRGPDGTGIDLLGVVEEAAVAELAAHVVALRALGAVDLPAPAAPAAAVGSPQGGPRSGAQSVDEMQAAANAAFAALAAEPPRPMTAPAPHVAASAGPVITAPVAVPGPAPATGPAIRAASFDELTPRTPERPTTSLDLLLGVNLHVTVEIGRTKLAIRDVLGLAPGSIVELDKLAGEPVDVLVNGRQIATGEVVVVDENFGVRITEIVSRQRRIAAGAAA